MSKYTTHAEGQPCTPSRDRCWKCGHEPRVDEDLEGDAYDRAVAAWFTGGLCPVCYDLVFEFGLGVLADDLDAMLEDPSDP